MQFLNVKEFFWILNSDRHRIPMIQRKYKNKIITQIIKKSTWTTRKLHKSDTHSFLWAVYFTRKDRIFSATGRFSTFVIYYTLEKQILFNFEVNDQIIAILSIKSITILQYLKGLDVQGSNWTNRSVGKEELIESYCMTF